ncbi:DUF1924 domain-containing protein [Motiliproteus sediminis]|uniref:DUF1924 domain-containing protein n=1 Tax=Motiliproteus sediminis TaxID=1468178 RepID=UPI001AEF76A0|nr:DUF1924 domain-containing protein [Motiliproteus sediminis]
MNHPLATGAVCALLSLSPALWAQSSDLEQLLQQYASEASQPFDAGRGEALWSSRNGDRFCGSCHTPDPRNNGEHQKTGKPIEPLAPSANPQRLTDAKQIKKWLLRNCKWTLGRECSAQEKGDFLTWLRQQ